MGWKTDIKIITEDGYMSLVPYVIEQTSRGDHKQHKEVKQWIWHY